ncbi:MAG: hypothetical protein PHF84_03960 [bacterium]|nr:hypothetical protein [bacterium]
MRNVKTLYFLVPLLLLCCSSGKNVQKDGQEKGTKSVPPPVTVITGKIEIYREKGTQKINEVHIVADWKTRSRINYRIENYKDLISCEGRIMKVNARILETTSIWSPKIRIVDIIEEVKEDQK